MPGVKIVFLDRDGVINRYPGDRNYVTSLEQFQLLPGVKGALAGLCAAGYRLYVVSNQAGVAKGLYSQETLNAMTAVMQKELAPEVTFSGIYYCTHLPDAGCQCRKPNTGSLDQVFESLIRQGKAVDRENSYFVGDSELDVLTGSAAGLKTVLVFSGRQKPGSHLGWTRQPDYTADDLAGAAGIILGMQEGA